MERLSIIVPKILLALTCLSFIGCEKKNDEQSKIEREVEVFWKYSIDNPDGFTIDITTFETPKEGIVVAYEATQNSFGREGLKRAIQHSSDHAHIIGGWLNNDNNKYYFDSDTIFQENMLDEAINWAKKNHQLAIYVLSEQKEIAIK